MTHPQVDNIGQSVECVIVVVECDGQGSVASSGDTVIGSNKGSKDNNTSSSNVEEPEQFGTLIVNKIVTCQDNSFEVDCQDIDSNFEPQDFIITVTGQNPNSSQFGGSSSGTEVTLEPGSYEATEDVSRVTGGTPNLNKIVTEDDNGNPIPSTSINLREDCITFSEDCSGTIEAGETKTCTITNQVQIVPTI